MGKLAEVPTDTVAFRSLLMQRQRSQRSVAGWECDYQLDHCYCWPEAAKQNWNRVFDIQRGDGTCNGPTGRVTGGRGPSRGSLQLRWLSSYDMNSCSPPASICGSDVVQQCTGEVALERAARHLLGRRAHPSPPVRYVIYIPCVSYRERCVFCTAWPAT